VRRPAHSRKSPKNFVRRYVEGDKKLRSKAEIERCLNTYVYPDWQDRPFQELRRADVTALLDKIQDKNGARQADLVLAIVRKMTHWYQSRVDDYVTPVVRGMRRATGAKRERVLSDDEIRLLWRAFESKGIDPHFGALVKLLLLTGQRLRKVAHMRRHDIADGVWTICTEAREKGNAGAIRLPSLALATVESVPKLEGNAHLFPAARGDGPLNSFSQRKKELDRKVPKGTARWTLHDLRRTARTLMARLRIDDRVAERTLGHTLQGIEAIYNKHSYADEKAAALERLAALIESIIRPPAATNVVPLRPSSPG
jgi:integrase